MSENVKDETYISLTRAHDLLKEKTGAKVTRPTLKTKLLKASEDDAYKGIIVQTTAHAWMQIHKVKFQNWYEGIYGKEEDKK